MTVTRVRLAKLSRAWQWISGSQESSDGMVVSDVVNPVISLPNYPLPAAAGFLDGLVGGAVGGAGGFFSEVGIFNNESAGSIVRLTRITIMNATAGALEYEIRRVDTPAGYTFLAAVPLYIDAGNPVFGRVGRIVRNNNAALQGTRVVREIRLEANSTLQFPVTAILNSGGLTVAGQAVNQQVLAFFNFEVFPIFEQQ